MEIVYTRIRPVKAISNRQLSPLLSYVELIPVISDQFLIIVVDVLV